MYTLLYSRNCTACAHCELPNTIWEVNSKNFLAMTYAVSFKISDGGGRHLEKQTTYTPDLKTGDMYLYISFINYFSHSMPCLMHSTILEMKFKMAVAAISNFVQGPGLRNRQRYPVQILLGRCTGITCFRKMILYSRSATKFCCKCAVNIIVSGIAHCGQDWRINRNLNHWHIPILSYCLCLQPQAMGECVISEGSYGSRVSVHWPMTHVV